MSDISAKRFLVGGKVQGVYYRRSAQKCAQELRLAGWVRNLPDGSVEAYACGPYDALECFAAWLQRGPKFARVSRVDIEPAEVVELDGFEVR